jgi:hypothetical protein
MEFLDGVDIGGELYEDLKKPISTEISSSQKDKRVWASIY